MEAYGQAKCRVFARMRRGQVAAIAAHHPMLERLRAACGGFGDHAYVGALPGVTVEATANTATGDTAADVPATCTARVQLPGDDTVIEVSRGASIHGAVRTLRPSLVLGFFFPRESDRAVEHLGCSIRIVRSVSVSSLMSRHTTPNPPLSYGSPPSISSNPMQRQVQAPLTALGGCRRSLQVPLGGLRAVGPHNRLNAATALLLSLALRLDGVHAAALTAALPTLQPPPHRMQVVGEVDGVLWVDDSKVTLTPHSSPHRAVRGLMHCEFTHRRRKQSHRRRVDCPFDIWARRA